MRIEPVTVVVSRKVKPGHEADYEKWIRDITEVALTFEGHLGMNVFKPTAPGEPYVLVYKFDRGENLDRWLTSAVRADFVKRAEAMCEETHAEHVTGLESGVAVGVDVEGAEHGDDPHFPRTVTTLVRPPGRLLARIATVNDVHFGEVECGRIDHHPEGPIMRREPGEARAKKLPAGKRVFQGRATHGGHFFFRTYFLIT